jgi:hypothetical protein
MCHPRRVPLRVSSIPPMAPSPSDMPPSGMLTVRIQKTPVAVWVAAQEHTDELLREFTLIATAQGTPQAPRHDVPRRLTALIVELAAQYGGFGEANEQRLLEAAVAGEDSVDLVYEVPVAVVDGARHLGELLDEADEYCRSGEHLLTLATSPELVAFRRWFLAEFLRQAAGEPPMPWPDYANG